MNFDELKNQWNQESVPNQPVPQLEQSLKRAGNAIDKVRKNMKKEFFGFIVIFLISLLGVLIVPHYVFVHKILLIIVWSYYLTFTLISGYFLLKFYKFYKRSYSLNYSMKDNLWWFYYELRSFVDFYYTFNLVGLVLGFSCGLSIGYIGANLKKVKGEDNVVSTYLDQMDGVFASILLAVMVVVVILGMIGLYYAVQYMYGKYLKQLKTTLDLLREE